MLHQVDQVLHTTEQGSVLPLQSHGKSPLPPQYQDLWQHQLWIIGPKLDLEQLELHVLNLQDPAQDQGVMKKGLVAPPHLQSRLHWQSQMGWDIA